MKHCLCVMCGSQLEKDENLVCTLHAEQVTHLTNQFELAHTYHDYRKIADDIFRSAVLGILCIISHSHVGGFVFLPSSHSIQPLSNTMQKVQICECGMRQKSFLVPPRTPARMNVLSLLRAQSETTGPESPSDFNEMAATAGATWEGILAKFGANGEKIFSFVSLTV